MKKIGILLTFICLFILTNMSYAQDTIRLKTKPQVIMKSWYPEFKEFPNLKIGESKILFIIIPDFEKLSIRNNDIDLKTSNSQIEIKETDKTNQYLITVNPTNTEFIEFELWLELGNKTILLRQNFKWKNIKMMYPFKDNRILIDTIKLKIIK